MQTFPANWPQCSLLPARRKGLRKKYLIRVVAYCPKRLSKMIYECGFVPTTHQLAWRQIFRKQATSRLKYQYFFLFFKLHGPAFAGPLPFLWRFEKK